MILEPAVRAEALSPTGGDHGPAADRRAVSFVSPKLVPAMAGAEDVLEALGPGFADVGDATVSGLVLNDRGYDRFIATGLRTLNVGIAVTDSFNQRNQGATREQVEALVTGLADRTRGDGVNLTVTLSVAFGCPFEGRVKPEQTLALVERVRGAGTRRDRPR